MKGSFIWSTIDFKRIKRRDLKLGGVILIALLIELTKLWKFNLFLNETGNRR